MQSESLPALIGHLAGVIAHPDFSSGDRAVLRRMAIDQPLPLQFYRFSHRHLPENWETSIKDWVVLVAGMATMSPRIHDPYCPFGRALAQEHFSETRLERLLVATDDVRRVLFLRAVRFLAAKSAAFNWVDAAQFLLTKDEEKREAVHRHIAMDFYQALEQQQERKTT